MENLSGSSLGQYQLQEQIGLGGMATVYRAFQPSLRREVAIKVLSAALAQQPGYMERFTREAEMVAALEHPNIVPIYDYGGQDGVGYVVMRLLTGGTLAERVSRRSYAGGPPPSLGEIGDLLKQLASALDYAHKRGVIHRDIKPSNIMFDDQGRAYLMDFGIAKLLEASESLTNSGVSMGTPAYMAPEQWRGEAVVPATDQYAVGVMIYGLLTGQPPFKAPTPYAMMHKHLTETPAPPQTIRTDLPVGVGEVLARAMAKNPEERFPTVSAMSEVFAAAISHRSRKGTAFFTETIESTSVGMNREGAGFVPSQPVPITQPPITPPPMTPSGWAAPGAGQLPGQVAGQMPDRQASYPVLYRRSQPRLFWWMSGGLVLLALLCACGFLLYLTGVIGGKPDKDKDIETVLDTDATPTSVYTDEPGENTPAPEDTGIPPNTSTPDISGTPGTPTAIPAGTGNRVWVPATREFDDHPVDVPFVYVPAGCFLMGSTDGQANEQPVHEICLSAFWMARTEITNDQYRACVQDGACNPPADPWMFNDPRYNDYPVVSISWNEAMAFAQWFGALLPTEAQWEYAARGPQSLVYPWGDNFNGSLANFCDTNCSLGWKDDNANDGYSELAPVGMYPNGASWVGALDLIGNAWEWTLDAYSDSTYAGWDDGALDPAGLAYGSERVLRGGSWTDEANNSRAAFRYHQSSDSRTGNQGFRVILIIGADSEDGTVG